MPDLEISKLPELAALDLQATDPLAIADLSAVETKKVTVKSLIEKGVDILSADAIDPDKIDWDIQAANQIKGTAIKDRSLPAGKLVANSLTASEIAPNAIGASELANDAVDTAAIANQAVTAGKIQNNSIGDGQIADLGIGTTSLADGAVTRVKMTLAANDIDGSVIADNSLTASEIAANAIGASELANNAVDTAAIANAAVTSAKIANDQVGDQHIVTSGLGTSSVSNGAITRAKMTLAANDIDGSVIADSSLTANELAANSVGASELANDAVDTAAIQDLAITSAKLGGDSVQSGHIASGAVNTTELAGSAVTNLKLATNSVSTDKVQDLSITAAKLETNLPGSIITPGGIDSGQLADASVTTTQLADASVATDKLVTSAVTDVKIFNVSGTKIDDGSIPAVAFNPAAFSNGIELDGTVQLSNEIAAGTSAGITWNSNGMITGFDTVPPEDLPLATATTVGAISVPAGSGLFVNAAGEIDHVTLIEAGTTSGLSYDEHGHINNAVPLVGTDLPVATNTDLGGVRFPTANSNPILVDGDGNVTFAESGVAAGTYVSLTVNGYGLVTAGTQQLTSAQLPGLDVSQITTGQFGTNRLLDNAVTLPKLADYSISFIQEAQPTITTDLHIGCLWYQESTAQLRMWNGNSFMPVGFGRLSQENLRFGGSINAATGLIVNLTDSGRAAGLEVGLALPVATDALGGLYVVVSTAGNNSGVTPGITYDSGDWCLCINEGEGWIRIDTLSSGGGGGLISLNDLIDVDINDAQGGDTLVYDPTSGQWQNISTSAERITLSPEFNSVLTTFELSAVVEDQNNVLMSIGGVILEPGVDFVIVGGTRQINFATAPPEDSPYFLINSNTINSPSGGGGGTDLPPGTTENEYLRWNNSLNSWGPASELDGGTY